MLITENQEARDDRAQQLEARDLNGLQSVIVEIMPPSSMASAVLRLRFLNDRHVSELRVEAMAATTGPHGVFRLRGGVRRPAGAEAGLVKVIAASAGADSPELLLTVAPVGDYSTYMLSITDPRIDPVFAEIPFKFRPGCFHTSCSPRAARPAREALPFIDYLSKDYESFRHLMLDNLRARVPGWQPTSEADFTQVLVDVVAGIGDRLSDMQDRVANEAFFATAKRRTSLARHARLVDYPIHQGSRASGWEVVEVEPTVDLELPEGTLFTTAGAGSVFRSARRQRMNARLNRMRPYTWRETYQGLPPGATRVDVEMPSQAEALAALALMVDPDEQRRVSRVVIQEWLSPGPDERRDVRKRQLLRLRADELRVRQDLVTGSWLLTLVWEEADALRRAYTFYSSRGDLPTVTLLHGNGVEAQQGLPVELDYTDEQDAAAGGELSYRRHASGQSVVLALPRDRPVLYEPTPRGSPPRSTLTVSVVTGAAVPYREVPSLLGCDENDACFVVETEHDASSIVRFGDGQFGQRVPDHARVHVRYASGHGPNGNVGADKLVVCDHPDVAACWNAFDIDNGQAPEPVAEVHRFAGEAYRAVQHRAIPLRDYVQKAEEVEGVARAAARYVWNGSWRAVRLVLDPRGTVLSEDDPAWIELSARVARRLEALRLALDDIEIRPPRYVPVRLRLVVCLDDGVWEHELRQVIEDELSAGHTAEGRRGLFHPDEWTFGQALHASQVLGRVQAVPGVRHVLELSMRRYHDTPSGAARSEQLELRSEEILLVENDPNHMERGFTELELVGGRP